MNILARTLWALVFGITLFTVQPRTVEAQQTFYSVSSFDDQLRIIDATTGATVSSVTITLSGNTVGWANGLAKHPQTGQLFALLSLLPDCDVVGPCARELVTIDPATGIATDIGNTSDAFAGLAFNSAGTLYGVTGDGAIVLLPETLYTLNPSNGTPTFVRILGNGDAGEAIAFNPSNGLLYHASGRNSKVFETINPNTLSVTNVPLSGDAYHEAVALTYWQSQGVFLMIEIDPPFFASPPSLLRVTPDGVVSFVGNVDDFSKGLAPTGPGSTIFHVDCSEIFLQDAINVAQSGDTILVSGFCEENLLVDNNKVRVFLNGGGTATIFGFDPSRPVVDVRGKAILIEKFTITGGSNGIEVQRGSNAVIRDNVIENNEHSGVMINQLAFAVLTNNDIQDNAEDGIVVKEGAAARIGFNSETGPIGENRIRRNRGGSGVRVWGSSSAMVVGNRISDNMAHGVEVGRGSYAGVADNTIDHNGGDGVHVGGNSMVNLGEDMPTTIFEFPNNTGSNNLGFGVGCTDGGIADGQLGSLMGFSGLTNFPGGSDCLNDLNP